MDKKEMKKILDEIVEDLWPLGCLEDGDNDPWTKWADGYCEALNDFRNKILKEYKGGIKHENKKRIRK